MMDSGPGLKAILRRLAFTLFCVLMIAMAAHMLAEPAKYSAAGGYSELRGGGGGGAAGAMRVLLKLSVDAVGTTATAAGLIVLSGAGLVVLWRPRQSTVEG